MSSTPKRRSTNLGLGASGAVPVFRGQTKDAQDDRDRPTSARPSSQPRVKREPIARTTEPPPGSAARPRVSEGMRVDAVGRAAVNIARASRVSAPHPTKARLDSKAPLDPQSAYVLSLVDGVTTVETLSDVVGLGEDQVHAILERLERLGLVTNA